MIIATENKTLNGNFQLRLQNREHRDTAGVQAELTGGGTEGNVRDAVSGEKKTCKLFATIGARDTPARWLPYQWADW